MLGDYPTSAECSTVNCTRSELIEYRTFGIASYILLHHSTIRQAADAYCVGKSSAHYYIHNVLSKLDRIQYDEVCTVLNENWNDRQRRGGMATARLMAERKNMGGT